MWRRSLWTVRFRSSRPLMAQLTRCDASLYGPSTAACLTDCWHSAHALCQIPASFARCISDSVSSCFVLLCAEVVPSSETWSAGVCSRRSPNSCGRQAYAPAVLLTVVASKLRGRSLRGNFKLWVLFAWPCGEEAVRRCVVTAFSKGRA